MTFTEIIELIQPYINITTVTTIAAFLIKVALDVKKRLSDASSSISQTALFDEARLVSTISKLMPSKLSVSIKPLVESELKKINENVQNATTELSQKTGTKIDTIARALASMRALPDEQRQLLLSMIDGDTSEAAAEIAVDYEISAEVEKLTESNAKEYVPIVMQ